MKPTIKNPIEPYPQDALDGALGLLVSDIADSLGVDAGAIRKKIKRHEETFNTKLFRSVQMDRLNNSGALYREWVLNVHAAKYLVAGWKNEMGVGYFQYLLACEEAAEKKIPELEAKIKKLSKKKTSNIKVSEKITEWTLFGWLSRKVTKTIPRDQADVIQLAKYRFKHRNAIMSGLMKKQQKELAEEIIIPDVDERKLLPSALKDL